MVYGCTNNYLHNANSIDPDLDTSSLVIYHYGLESSLTQIIAFKLVFQGPISNAPRVLSCLRPTLRPPSSENENSMSRKAISLN